MGMLLLLLSISVLVLAGCVIAFSLFTKRAWLAKTVFGFAFIWIVLYGGLLFGYSVASEEKVLERNEAKEFCGFYFDCHLHVSVLDVRRQKQIGTKTAQGEFVIVKTKVSSDARREPLRLNDPEFRLLAKDGQKFARDIGAENEPGGSTKTPFDQKVEAGKSFEREIVFDVPAEIREFKLYVNDTHGIDSVFEAILIDDEESLLHKKTCFRINEQTVQAGVK